MIFVAGSVMLIITAAVYSCCHAAGKADDWEEQWLEEHDKK